MSNSQEPDYEKLLQDYRDLQLRVTRFSSVEQELINTRDRLDQELVLYKRLNQFNKTALKEFSDEQFFKLVTESVIDIFETESSILIAKNYSDNDTFIFTEGMMLSSAEYLELQNNFQDFTTNLDSGKSVFLSAKDFQNISFFNKFSKGLYYSFSDTDFGYQIYLFSLISKEYDPVYRLVPARHETIFSVFSQQVQSLLANRKKESKIREQFQKISASESELKKLSKIATKTQNGVIISDAFGQIEWVNDAFTKITGYSLDEVMGKKPKDFLQGKETDKVAIEKIKQALWNKKNVEQVIINYNKFNQPYYNSLQITPIFDDSGSLTNFIALQKDITDEINSKQEIINFNSRFELIANKSGVGIWELDVSSGKASWNKILEEQYGASPKNLRENFSDYLKGAIHPDDANYVASNYQELLHSTNDLLEQEFRIIRHSDKEIRTLKSLIIAIRDKFGKLTRLVGTNNDITERKNTEKELQKNLSQQELLSDTAVELNNVGQFYNAINSVLSKVGVHTGVSRVYIFENTDGGNACNNTYEWCNSGVVPQIENLQGIPYDMIPFWKNELNNSGYIFSENIIDLPQEVRDILEPQEIKSIIVFPLTVRGEFFGFIGFDECIRNKKWSKSEFTLLRAFSGIISNAYERKLSDDSLIASEKKYRSIIENMNLGLVETNSLGEVIFSNRQFHKLTKVENPAWLALGPNPEEILKRKELQNLVVALRKIDELVYEMGIRTEDGQLKTLLVSNAAVKEQKGEGTGYISIFLDITPVKSLQLNLENALKERDIFLRKVNSLKSFYEHILNQSPSDIAVVGPDMKLNYSNEHFTEFEKIVRLTEISEGSEVQGILLNHIKEALKERKLIQKEEYFMDNSGKELYKLRSILPVYNKEEQLEHIIISGVDISEIKRIENTLVKRNEELNKTNSELDNFVYSVSHDLRSPLLSIKGILSLIFKGDQIDKKVRDYLHMVDRSVNRLDGTIQEILEYSRNTRLEVKQEATDIKRIIEEVYEDLMFGNDQKIRFDLHVRHTGNVITDSSRITTVLKNIIGNAFKYQKKQADEGWVKVTLDLLNNELLLIEVEDNGEGISEKSTSKVFDMFYRASNTSVGTGLGLYICKEIISKLNGEIELFSKLNEGTKVTIKLPVKLIKH